jgi:hypothetical protein
VAGNLKNGSGNKRERKPVEVKSRETFLKTYTEINQK